ncbi:MAG: hypothetical protein RLZZ126_364 [Pseudomonadota bacterium]
MTSNDAQLISDLMDGQLQGADVARAVELVASDPTALATWMEFNLGAEVLRSGVCTGMPLDPNLHGKVMAALAREPGSPAMSNTPLRERAAADAANDSQFRWRLVAGLASVVVVGALAWNLVGTSVPAADVAIGPAAVERPVVVAGQERVMVRDPHLDALLSAHKQLGGASALQKPSGFLRNATFEGPER